MNIAWSTAAILALLLPGFFFIRGIGLAEPFSRDAAPRSPIALLALTVLMAIFTHTLGLWLVDVLGQRCDLGAVLALAAGQLSGTASLESIVGAIDPFRGRIALYFGVCSVGGLGVGWLIGRCGVRWEWLGKLLFEHAWLHSLSRKGRRSIAYALTNVELNATPLLYVGEVERFGIRQDGRFSFLLLRNASRAPLKSGEGAERNAWKSFDSDKPGLMYLDGESIANVFVQTTDLPEDATSNVTFRKAAIEALKKLDASPPPPAPPPSRSTTPTGS